MRLECGHRSFKGERQKWIQRLLTPSESACEGNFTSLLVIGVVH